MSAVDPKRVQALAEAIAAASKALARRRELQEKLATSKAKLQMLVDGVYFDITMQDGWGYKTSRGREMFDLAAKKLLSGLVDEAEAQLVGLQAELAKAVRP